MTPDKNSLQIKKINKIKNKCQKKKKESICSYKDLWKKKNEKKKEKKNLEL